MNKPKLEISYDLKNKKAYVNTEWVFFMMQTYGIQPEALMTMVKDADIKYHEPS